MNPENKPFRVRLDDDGIPLQTIKDLFTVAHNEIARKLAELPDNELPIGCLAAGVAAAVLAAYYGSATHNVDTPDEVAKFMREAPWEAIAVLALDARGIVLAATSKGDA